MGPFKGLQSKLYRGGEMGDDYERGEKGTALGYNPAGWEMVEPVPSKNRHACYFAHSSFECCGRAKVFRGFFLSFLQHSEPSLAI